MWVQTSPYAFYVLAAFLVACVLMGTLWWRSLKGLHRAGDPLK
jgi:hypothetical protein